MANSFYYIEIVYCPIERLCTCNVHGKPDVIRVFHDTSWRMYVRFRCRSFSLLHGSSLLIAHL